MSWWSPSPSSSRSTSSHSPQAFCITAGCATRLLRFRFWLVTVGSCLRLCRAPIPTCIDGGMSEAGVRLRPVLARYRYRIYPTASQQGALARAFGCARVVFNDCIRLREQCHERGEKTSDTEIQQRVITLAKQTPERDWLGQVSSVVLVQACQDARRAYKNWLDYMAGRRKGPKVGRPRYRRKHGRQSIRFTRNGFALHGKRLYVAKVGDLVVKWSRDLPSAPSSVTVIREPDGRYYASFVVDREQRPLPPVDHEVGIDVGLASLVVTSDGQVITNPRFLRAAERRLKKAQRNLSRKQKGSQNRARARHKVAVLHRKVRDKRTDHAHKTALALVRDSQAVYCEDIAVSGLARTRLAKSIHDAGWSQLLRLVEQKAAYHGRHFARIGRFEPTSQVCSACGIKDGPKPLAVRHWTCKACGTIHDRDVNAAQNILVAGQADRLNASGCDTKSRLLSGLPERRPASAGWLIPDQCQGSVPVLACVAGNRGVRSPGKCPRAAVPPGGHRLGKAGRVNVSEPSMMPREFYLPAVGCVTGGQGPAAARRQALARDHRLARTAPPSPGYRGHPIRPGLADAERGNPVRSGGAAAGRPTVRKAEARGGNRKAQEAKASGRKAAGGRCSRPALSAGAPAELAGYRAGCPGPKGR